MKLPPYIFRALLALLAVAATLPASATYPFIYRNDNKFNKINTDGQVVLRHNISATDAYFTLGNERIPLTAVDRIEFRQTDIPTLSFTFPDHPDYDWVVEKETYINATLDIDGAGITDDASGLELTVKGRGNSTWWMRKKPMRLKFAKKTSICGFEKAKSYVLLANYIDMSHAKNAAGLWLASRLGMEFANHTMPCNVYVNGKYHGLYLLTEKIGVNKASVDINESTGVLLELSNDYDEKYKFTSSDTELPVMVKDPDFDELYEEDPTGPTPEERLASWEQDFNRAEALSLRQKGDQVFDVNAAVDYYLTMYFVKNHEIGWPKSMYMYKRDLGPESLYYFGPVWDLDAAFNKCDTPNEPASAGGEIWCVDFLSRMMQQSVFQERLKERIEEMARVIYPEMREWLLGYAHVIEPGAKLDGLRWPVKDDLQWVWRESSFDTDRHIADLVAWLDKRMKYLAQKYGCTFNVPDTQPGSITSTGAAEIPSYVIVTGRNGAATAIPLADGLEIRLADGAMTISSSDTPFVCELSDIERLEYSVSPSAIDTVAADNQSVNVMLHDGIATITTGSQGVIEVFDTNGRRLYSARIEGTTDLPLCDCGTGILLITFNGETLLKTVAK